MRYTLDDLRDRRVLLVASTGGHLTQLRRLAPRLGIAPDSPWLTFDTPQSRSLLDGQDVHHVPYVRPRDWRGIMVAAQRSREVAGTVDGAISTGAGLALAVLPSMALRGKLSVYIESISRVQGPSVSGRILSTLPRIGMYCQHAPWVRRPWKLGPSVLADYDTRPQVRHTLPKRILVTLGTIRPYRFDRLVDTVLAYVRAHPDTEVLWQLGVTSRNDLPGKVTTQLSADEFSQAIDWADIVVAHSGVGVALNIMDGGKVPVLLARRHDENEHVDDHQFQIHDYLIERGLAVDAADAFSDECVLAQTAATDVIDTSREHA